MQNTDDSPNSAGDSADAPARNLRRVIGHRGVAALAPENTIAGFRRAASLGLTRIEFDIRLSADGRPVVIHDKTLDRTTDGTGAVAETPFEAIRALDAGTWFAPEFAGQRVPALQETLQALAALGVTANLEIKADEGKGEGVADAVLAALAEMPDSTRPEMLVASYNAEALAVFRDAMPEIPRALVVRRLGRGWRSLVGRLGCHEIHGNHHFLTRKAIREVTEAGLSVAAFTVDDAVHARRLLGWGVAQIISNDPDSLLFGHGAR